MPNTQSPGPAGQRPLRPGILPLRSPGPLGINDAAAPFVSCLIGNCPAVNLSYPITTPHTEPKQLSSEDKKKLYTKNSLDLVEHYINAARKLDLKTCVELYQFWRDGGDDRSGDGRTEDKWNDEDGNPVAGKRLPASIFWPSCKTEVINHLQSTHRKRYVDGAARRLKSGELAAGGWSADLHFTNSVGNTFWPFKSDIRWAIGGCSMTSSTSISLTTISRGGKCLPLASPYKPVTGDQLTFAFEPWNVHVADNFVWVHGDSDVPADMPLMDLEYWLFHNEWQNPQEKLHELETPDCPKLYYPAGKHVYARPFAVISDDAVINDVAITSSFTLTY